MKQAVANRAAATTVLAALLVLSAAVGCKQTERQGEPRGAAARRASGRDARATSQPAATKPATAPQTTNAAGAEPCPSTSPTSTGPSSPFAVDSPFDTDYKPPATGGGKRIWARSFLWEKAPELVVEKWLTQPPRTEGKVVLIEFWATWCPPCRRSIALLNRLHEKHGKQLVVIGISEEPEADVRKLKQPAIRYYSAIDTQARTKKTLGVYGIPHVIIVEPGGHVIWEGFPLLKGHELTEATIEKILRVGRERKSGRPE